MQEDRRVEVNRLFLLATVALGTDDPQHPVPDGFAPLAEARKQSAANAAARAQRRVNGRIAVDADRVLRGRTRERFRGRAKPSLAGPAQAQGCESQNQSESDGEPEQRN